MLQWSAPVNRFRPTRIYGGGTRRCISCVDQATCASTRARNEVLADVTVGMLLHPPATECLAVQSFCSLFFATFEQQWIASYTCCCQDYFDARRTLAEKVLKSTATDTAQGGQGGATSSSSPSLFSFGERHREQQKAKSLAKINTPHKRYEKKVSQAATELLLCVLSMQAGSITVDRGPCEGLC